DQRTISRQTQDLSRPQSVENAPDRGARVVNVGAVAFNSAREAPDKAQGQHPRCNTTPQAGQMKCP
ncbi:MAG: hypothetical protein ACKVG4_16455, partial [Longimicrobiales bacterium]